MIHAPTFERNFLGLLQAPGRSPEIPEAQDAYGWLVGSWELDVLHYKAVDVSLKKFKGEAHFDWVLEGRAIQDVWIMPVPSDRTPELDRINNMPARQNSPDANRALSSSNFSVREEDLKPRSFYFRSDVLRIFLFLVAGPPCAAAQGPPAASADQTLAQSVQELRRQVEDLRAAVVEIRSEASQYRAESEQLRKELESMTALQVAANPYVAVLGPSATASSRLNLAQAFNSLGTTIGPYIGGLLILSAAPKSADILHQMTSEAVQLYRQQQASSVKLPYLIFAAVLLALSIAIGRFKLPAMAEATHHQSQAGEASLWEYRHLVLGAVGIFTYVGAEVAIGSFLINYLAQPSIGNMSEVEAARYVSYYWGGAMVGRFIGSAVLQTVKTSTVVATAAILACFLVITSMLSFGHMAVWSIILVGLFNSIMFPSIFTMGIEKLGPRTGDGSGILIMAIVGGAIIPVVQGAIADRIGIHHAFFLPAICYLYILYYALRGSRPVLPVSHGGAMAQ